MMPTALWSMSQKKGVDLILGALVDEGTQNRKTVRVLNMRLKTFEVLLRTRFAPHRVMRASVKGNAKYNVNPLLEEFWNVLEAGLEGKGFVELTN